MFKKSFQVLLIQIGGILLGFLSIYLIAGDMEPQVYSLVGIYTIISGILLTFSDLGIETTMMREALFWKSQAGNEKIIEYTTQSLVSRILGCLILSPFLLLYLMILNISKYNGSHTFLLICFLLGAVVSTLNDSMALIIRSQGGYVFSQLASTANNYFIKFLGILVYYWLGETVYLYFYGFSSIPLLFIFIYKLKDHINLKYIAIRQTINKIYEARYLWLKTDIDYFKGNADSLLVSLIFPTSVMGSYTLYKNFENMMRRCIEGFFDVLSQSTVAYKGQKDILEQKERKIKQARYILILAIMFGCIIFWIYSTPIIQLIHLQKYAYIKEIILCIAFVGIAYLVGKYEINALALFASSKLNFKMGLIIFAGTISSFGLVLIWRNIYGVLLQRLLIYLLSSILAIVIFKKIKEQIYEQITS